MDDCLVGSGDLFFQQDEASGVTAPRGWLNNAFTKLIRYMRDNDYTRVVPTGEAEDAWTEHVYEIATRMLLSKVDSWFMGINTNVPGK